MRSGRVGSARRHRLLVLPVFGALLFNLQCTCAYWMLRVPIEVDLSLSAGQIKDPGRIWVKRNRDTVEWKVKKGTLEIKWSEKFPEGYDSPPPASEISCEGKKCTFVPREKSGKFKYTITVTQGEQSDSLDPDVVVMD